jgi:PPOX class probable F420-dependent enzyme
MAVTFADVARAEYILLTTFTRDGRAKPTAVWAAPDGDRLLVITQEKSWKVKRLRNTSRVEVAICDRAGKPKSESVEATATILDKSANAATYDALGKRYGLIGKIFNVFSKLRGGMKNNVTIEIKAV